MMKFERHFSDGRWGVPMNVRRRGQSLVEMALVLPILLLLLIGLIEFGRAFFIYAVVSNAAREGVRAGIVEPLDFDYVKNAVTRTLVLVPPGDVDIDIHYDDGTDEGTFTDPAKIEEGRSRIGTEVDVVVTSILQTPAGRMVFARAAEAGTDSGEVQRAVRSEGAGPPQHGQRRSRERV